MRELQKELDTLKRNAAMYISDAKARGEKKMREAECHATLWQGKYRIVCHENNALRRRNEQLRQLLSASGTLTGEDARKFMESAVLPAPLTPEEAQRLRDNYEHFRKISKF